MTSLGISQKCHFDCYCTPEGCQDGEEDAEVAQLVCEESGEGRREDEEDGDDGVDHRGLLHADAQVLKRWKKGGVCQSIQFA